MSKFKNLYNNKIDTSRLILVFEADSDAWEENIYCKPCPKRSYAFWIAEMSEFNNITEAEVKKMLGKFTELMAKLVCLCCCTENGEAVFDYKTDIDVLCELDDSDVLKKLFMGACQANGIETIAIEFDKVFSEIDNVFENLGDAFADDKGAAKKGKPKKRASKKAS